MSSVEKGLQMIPGLFSACNFFDEALWRCCVLHLFYLFLVLRRVYDCFHRTFKAKMTPFKLLLKCFIKFP